MLGEHKIEEPAVHSIGLGDGITSSYANSLLELRPLRNLKDSGIDLSSLPLLQLSSSATTPRSVPGKLKIEQRTYNKLSLNVDSSAEALLVWRDTYSPYWKATVNAKEIHVTKAFGGFKAVPVPAGKSVAEFRFRPPVVPRALLVSYILIAAVAISWLFSFRFVGSSRAKGNSAWD